VSFTPFCVSRLSLVQSLSVVVAVNNLYATLRKPNLEFLNQFKRL